MILVVDTALAHAQVAVVANGRVLGHAVSPAQGDAEAVVDHAAAALAAAGIGWGDLAAVVATMGPGSFTGVRVGIAFAKGIAAARALPATGVSTLAAIARAAGGTAVAVVDARHGQVFAALYRDGALLEEGRMAAADAARLALSAGARLAGPDAALAVCGADGIAVNQLPPLAVAAAAVPGTPLSALYLAPVDATPQTHKALAEAPAW